MDNLVSKSLIGQRVTKMHKLTISYTKLRERFQKSDEGSMTVLFAQLLPVILCALALCVDYGNSSMVQAEMQRAADAAVLAAGEVYNQPNATQAEVIERARAILAATAGAKGATATVVVNTAARTVKVALKRPFRRLFSNVFWNQDPSLSVHTQGVLPSSSSKSSCHSDAGGNDTGGASGVDFVLSNNETVTLPDMNGKTINVSGYGTVQFSHDANGATLIINSSCVNVTSLGHDFNTSKFIDNYVPPKMNFVSVAHSCNNCTFSGGSEGSGGVFKIGHDANGSSFTFITCAGCTSTSGDSTSGNGPLRLTD